MELADWTLKSVCVFFLIGVINNKSRSCQGLRTQYGPVLLSILQRLGLERFQSKRHFVQRSNTLFLGIHLSKYDGLISRGFLNSPALFHSVAEKNEKEKSREREKETLKDLHFHTLH